MLTDDVAHLIGCSKIEITVENKKRAEWIQRPTEKRQNTYERISGEIDLQIVRVGF